MYGGRTVAAIRRHHRGDLWPQYVAYDTANNSVGSLDATPADKGGFWSLLFGSWVRANGHIAATSNASLGIAKLGDCLNGSITAGIMCQDWHFDGHGLAFRIQDKDNYLVMVPTDPSNTGAGTLKIFSNIAGVKTELASGSCNMANSATNESFKVTFDNTRVQAYGNILAALVLKTTYILSGPAAALTGTGCGLQASGQPIGESRGWVDEYTLVKDPYPDYLVFDDFNRPDAVSLGNAVKGGPWLFTSGPTTYAIAGGKAVAKSNVTNPIAYFDVLTGEFTAQVDVNVFGGIFFRIVDNQNFWAVAYDGGTNCDLVSVDAGVVTISARTVEVAQRGTIQIDARGTTLKMSSNGVLKTTFTSAVRQTATQVGINGALSDGDTFNRFWVKP